MKSKNESQLAAEKILQEVKSVEGKLNFPIDSFKILNKNNTIITFSDFENLEGLLLLEKDKKSIVSININRPVTRQRFTAAHELGHLILHKKINSSNFLCPIENTKSKIEKEADEFASHLLMPNDELIKQVNKYQNSKGKIEMDDCLYISEYFGVSFEACLKTIQFRLRKFEEKISNKELNNRIKKYKPLIKRKELIEKTNDLQLLRNIIKYSYFSIINVNNIIGIKFMQNLIYHDNRMENINIDYENVKMIYADLRVNETNSKYCKEENRNIIEVLGNIEMNNYCFTTTDEINVFKIKKLHELLYKYSPYPECAGRFKNTDNIIYRGEKQPVTTSKLFERLEEIDELVNELKEKIDNYDIPKYIEKTSIIHHKLTVLYPFDDGNGRISRAFMNWLLRLRGLCPIYIDSNNKKEYLDALHEIDNNNNTEKLQIIIIKSIIKTMSEIHKSWN